MTAPDFCTWDGSVSEATNPYRPGLNDVGGAAFVDDSQYLPDPTTQLSAIVENQNEMQIVALGKIAASALIYVKISGGTPSIFSLRAASSILLTTDFTITDHGNGDTELTCPATKLIQPFGVIATPQLTGDFRISAYVNGTSNGIRVETRNSAGTLTDCDWVAYWL